MNIGSTIIACPACQTKNRVSLDKADKGPRCGKCGAALPAGIPDHPVVITDATFDQEVFGASLPVLVDCWAPWCGPCKMLGPILDELAQTYRGRLKIAKLNVDENPRTASRYSIQSIPTLLLVKQGKLMDTIVGAPAKNDLVNRLNQFI